MINSDIDINEAQTIKVPIYLGAFVDDADTAKKEADEKI